MDPFFMTPALLEGEWLASRSFHFTPGEGAYDTHTVVSRAISRNWSRSVPYGEMEFVDPTETRTLSSLSSSP
jgi:hypothetical protein